MYINSIFIIRFFVWLYKFIKGENVNDLGRDFLCGFYEIFNILRFRKNFFGKI